MSLIKRILDLPEVQLLIDYWFVWILILLFCFILLAITKKNGKKEGD